MMTRSKLAAFFTFAVVHLTNHLSNASFSVTIDSGEEACVAVRTPKDQRAFINGNFDVINDELPPDPVVVSLYKEETMTSVWKSNSGSSEGNFAILGEGRHLLCIRNGEMGGDDMAPGNSDGIERTVGFSIRVVPIKRGLTEKAGPDDEKTAKLIEMSNMLMEGLETMMDHQAYLRSREAVHRDLTEKTFRRVVRWTILEAVVLMAVSGGQVMYLKKFFEQRRYL